MNGPCRAKCANQRENRCQLDDERIRLNRVEFGDEWDPVQHCSGYRPAGSKTWTNAVKGNMGTVPWHLIY